MIHYLTSAARFAPMQLYLKDWGARLRRRVRLIAYEDRPAAADLPDATFVFADVDRLGETETAAAAALWEALAARGRRVRLLNRPGVSMRRAQLLAELHRRGWNDFAVRPAAGPLDGLRFPVFLRDSHEHEGAATPLLPDAAALAAALARLVAEGRDPRRLLAVEFLDTVGPDGLYRKYAATVVDGRVIAHHVMFARDWEVKGPSLAEPEMLAEERAYQLANPHATRLRELFRLAHIDYGRVDYGVLGSALQIWAIDTNPTLLDSPRRYTAAQLPARRWFVDQLDAALLAIDDRSPPQRSWFGLGLRRRSDA